VSIDAVEIFDPTIRKLMPDPHTVTQWKPPRNASLMRLPEKSIAIFGDYDVDGATSAALAWHLRHGLDPLIHSRPISKATAPMPRPCACSRQGRHAAGDGGLRHHQFRLYRSAASGMPVVVIDHHQSGDELPDVDVGESEPARRPSGLGHLAAVGLVLVTLVAVNRELRSRDPGAVKCRSRISWACCTTALGTVADVAPLIGPIERLLPRASSRCAAAIMSAIRR
jgi:single-stranded-DNA-specific exonuclease